MPPAGTICTLLRSRPACFSDISSNMLLTEPGEVKPTRLPTRSLIPLSGESGFAIHRMSPTDSTPPLTIFNGWPALIASSAAESATSP